MGGDGGTLNNTRREHTSRARHQNQLRQNRQRASVTHCAASKQPLTPPLVIDRLGNLYNKEALLAVLLSRIRENTSPAAFAHIRSLKKDTAAVKFATSSGQRVCPVTRKAVTEEARFTVGWICGCVVADAALQGMPHADHRDQHATDVVCVLCQTPGERVRLGMTLEERERIRERIEKEREQRKNKKRKRVDPARENVVEQKVPRVPEEPVK